MHPKISNIPSSSIQHKVTKQTKPWNNPRFVVSNDFCVDHVGSFSLSYNTKKRCMTRCESTYATIQLLSRILDYTEMRHVIFIFLNLKSHSYTIFLRCTRRPICEWKCIPSSHPVAKQLQWECEGKKSAPKDELQKYNHNLQAPVNDLDHCAFSS